MINIAICDDLQKDRQKLYEDVTAYFSNKEEQADILVFESGDELVARIKEKDFHIVFMDKYMEGISGVEASERIRELGKECAIIFTTTSPDHAMAGFGVGVSDYLLKPFERDDVFTALDYAIERIPKNQQILTVISNRNTLDLQIKDISYIEVYGHESMIHMADGEVVSTNQALKALEGKVGENFERCHKSYLVNLAYVARPIDGAFLMKNEEKVPIGTDLESKSRERFFDWAFNRTWKNL